ncbi:unnamed protein product [Kuraishia capsulata CBS 1993]|uniref:Major facilitator superfamily (MFS) profile domain-containing protein n=1 Tax=Kuraishia capsulata CBS 1993 TaxID=1382522 RepID=W6MUF6_9ASCO|nr:uncharacterized protein KUCA_T00001550001 [Kuraishia capsulata CBS 1993]CDK25580.1 unnamed protein product [Kuraishia capsulata CBS 1993]
MEEFELDTAVHLSASLSPIELKQATLKMNGNSDEDERQRGGEEIQQKEKTLEESLNDINEGPPYSIYSSFEKYLIILASSCVAFFSTISSPIYLPILPLLEKQFNSSEEGMNISVVVYSVFQGIAPTLFSNLSDQYGRRPVILACLVIYILSNVGLALNNSYAGLLLLRCLQALGIASTVSIVSGVVSDLTTKRERGLYMGTYTSFSNLGQTFGALIGGAIEVSFNWRAIFWVLAIASGTVGILFFLGVPETNRSMVGNGSSLPQRFRIISRPPILTLPTFRRRRIRPGEQNPTLEKKKKFDLLSPIKTLANAEVALILTPSSVSYSLWLMMLTTLSVSIQKTYGWTSALKVGLTYIPAGVGGMASSILFGKLLDYNYKRVYKKFLKENEALDQPRDQAEFDVLQTRIPVFFGPVILTIVGTLLFGWSIDNEINVACVIVGSCLLSAGAMPFVTVSTTILVDMYPNKSSAAVACLNLTRCLTAAVGLAVLSLMNHSMTIGGTYTFLAGLTLISSSSLLFLYVKRDFFHERRMRRIEEHRSG